MRLTHCLAGSFTHTDRRVRRRWTTGGAVTPSSSAAGPVMSKRLVIAAVTVGKSAVSEVARTYGAARSWIYALLERYRAEGEAAFVPRSCPDSRTLWPGATTFCLRGCRTLLCIRLRPYAGPTWRAMSRRAPVCSAGRDPACRAIRSGVPRDQDGRDTRSGTGRS